MKNKQDEALKCCMKEVRFCAWLKKLQLLYFKFPNNCLTIVDSYFNTTQVKEGSLRVAKDLKGG